MKPQFPSQAIHLAIKHFIPKIPARPRSPQERIKALFLTYVYLTASTGAASGALSESTYAADFMQQSLNDPNCLSARVSVIAAYWLGGACGGILGAFTGPCVLPYLAYKLYELKSTK